MKYSSELGHTVAVGTVRNFKCKYLEQLKTTRDPDAITSLPHAMLGRPLLIGKFDDKVAEYIGCVRLFGGIVNSSIVIAAAKGIIAHKNHSFLKAYDGTLDLKKNVRNYFANERVCLEKDD